MAKDNVERVLYNQTPDEADALKNPGSLGLQ